jgi:hypothetical protein
MRSTFRFPNPVDETAARVVAAGVVAMAAAYLVTRSGWVLVALAYGFVARVAAGPTLSPLGRLATGVITPRLPGPHRHVPGPPKRFAQGIGAVVSVGAGLAHGVGVPEVAVALVGALAVAALLESALAVCLGCRVFAVLMRAGVVPASVCAECRDITARLAAAEASSG